MTPTPEVEAKGFEAYEQARAFERLRSWRLPLMYTAFAVAPALSGVVMAYMGHTTLAGINVFAALVLGGMGLFQWRQLQARHAENLRLLAELKAEYGDQLPWVQVENHFAALAELKRSGGPADGSKASPEK